MRFGRARATPLALLLAGAASVAEAQYIHGRVTDAQSGSGIASASVLIVNPDNSIRTGAITDRDGNFSFRTTPGTFQLRVQRVGYATTGSMPLELARTDTLSFAVSLPLRPTEITPLTVSAEGAPLDPSGFFARRDDSSGRFLGPYEVERRRPVTPADLLHDIPGFQITPESRGFRVLMTGRNRRCEPTVYVDGALAHRGTQTNRMREASDEPGLFLESLVNANAIRAMEAYQNGATAPVRFRPVGPVGGGDCGVLVFWTRVGFGR
jgi:hypothetical protein